MKTILLSIPFAFLSVLFTNAQTCFKSSLANFSTTTTPTKIISADFNHDGNIDIAVNDHLTTKATILYGDGSGAFPNEFILNVPFSDMPFTTADLNNDSLTDLVFSYDSIYVFISGGMGMFTKTVYSIPGYAYNIASGDFNNDNNIDVLVSINSGSHPLAMFPGNGMGNLNSYILSQTVNTYTSLFVSDINNDLNADVILINSNSIEIMNGNGSGTFVAGQNIPVNGTYTQEVKFANLNGDNFPDLLVADIYHNITRQFLNDGTGLFLPEVDVNSSSPVSLGITDFNHDGYSDVATAEWSATNYLPYGFISLKYGDGNGGYSHYSFFSAMPYPRSLTVNDFNNDGWDDIAVSSDTMTQGVIMLLNSSGIDSIQINCTQPVCPVSPGSATATITGISPAYNYFWIGDWNGLTDTNQAATNLYGPYHLIVNITNGCEMADTFSVIPVPNILIKDSIYTNGCQSAALSKAYASVSGGTPPYLYSWNTNPPQSNSTAQSLSAGQYIISIIDNNNCPATDTIVVPGTILLDGGNEYPTIQKPRFIISGDFNSDQLADIATLNDSNSVSILLNNGFGTFQNASLISLGLSSNHLLFDTADFNNDGNVDLMIAQTLSVSVLLGNGAGGFSAPITTSVPGLAINTDLAIADYNNDGFRDILVYCYSNGQTFLLDNLHNGHFFVPTNYIFYNWISQLVPGDFNHDSLVDFVSILTGGMVNPYYNNGNGTFVIGSSPQSPNVTGNIILSTVQDINNDGNDDVLIESNFQANVAFGNSTGGFGPVVQKPLPFNATSGVITDIDNDGNSGDLVSVSTNTNNLYIMTCNSSGMYSDAIIYSVGKNISGITAADYNNNGKMDIALSLPDSNQVKVFMDCGFTGIEIPAKLSKLKVYPNPAQIEITISGDYPYDSRFRIFDCMGKKVLDNKYTSEKINIENFLPGIYEIHISNNEKYWIAKFIVE